MCVKCLHVTHFHCIIMQIEVWHLWLYCDVVVLHCVLFKLECLQYQCCCCCCIRRDAQSSLSSCYTYSKKPLKNNVWSVNAFLPLSRKYMYFYLKHIKISFITRCSITGSSIFIIMHYLCLDHHPKWYLWYIKGT